MTVGMRGRKNDDEDTDDFWPWAEEPATASSARPTGDPVLPVDERRLSGDRRAQTVRRPMTSRLLGAEGGSRRDRRTRGEQRRSSQLAPPAAMPTKPPREHRHRRGGLPTGPRAPDVGLLLLALVVAVLVYLALTS